MPIITRKTVSETFLERTKASGSAIGFQFKPTYVEMGPVGQWKQVTFREFYQECRLLSFGLMGCGVSPGDRVAILSNTRFEWSLSDMAILGAGGVTVPIYASSTQADVAYILEHAEVKVVFVEDTKQLQKLVDQKAEKPESFPKLEKVVVYEPSAIRLGMKLGDLAKNVVTLQAMRELGKREEGKEPNRFDQNLKDAKPEDLITICYTSGTTGTPKGAMLTHDSMMSVLEDCTGLLAKFMDPENEVVVSFLPFSHILGKVESMCVYAFGWRQVFAENLDKLMINIGEVRPTVMFAVPRIFEKAYNRLHAVLDEAPPVRKKLFHWAFEIGRRYYGAIWEKRSPALKDVVEYQVAKKLVFRTVAQRFGGRLRFAVCGGAPLPREIGEFFQIVGIQICEGYGLTETCAPVTLNLPDDARFGVVGRPLPEVTIKIGEDGEILVKSRKVFKAYYKMPDETSQAIRDGWLYTGDIGYIDSEGFLHITDRKKDLIVTSGGKNIAPQKIENIAKSQKFVSQFVVHGDRRHYLTALVTLDKDQTLKYAQEQQILFSEYSELIRNPKIIALVQRIIDEVNRSLASFESIKKFVILPNEFTVESGELTPSMKVRRSLINQRYKAELDSMYADSARVSLDSSQDIR